MAYSTAYEIYENLDFRNRVFVALTILLDTGEAPESWYYRQGLKLASSEEIVKKWEKTKTTQPYHSRLGYDENVISDAMIKNAVLAILNPPTKTDAEVQTESRGI